MQKLRRIFISQASLMALFLMASVSRAADDAAQNTLTDKEKADGWKLLFDGKTTKAWHQYKGKGVGDRWKAVDGTLALMHKGGKEGGDIITDENFGNFELAIDWKVTPGANSGIMYRVSEKEDAPYYTGPEYQILDNAKHEDGKNPKTSAASCYALYAPTKDVCKPVGEWNHARILVKDNHVEHWLNDVKVVEYDFGSKDWKDRVAASKFKDLKNFGAMKKGGIDLQDHGDDVAYRNIKVRVLGDKPDRQPKASNQ
jgi:hypothetical protein